MVNKKGYIVCDYTGIILNDNVTLYPGYVEIKDNKLYRYDSLDPQNKLAKLKPWVLHNRVKYNVVAKEEECTNKKLQGKHFMSKKAMNAYLTK